jgi:hypothetical protein
MRRYFSILAVAVATIFLTACKLSDGDTPNPQRSNQLIWDRVADGLKVEHGYMQIVVALNEIMLGHDAYMTAYGGPSSVNCEEGEYTLVYNISSYHKEIYSIQTGGKRLDEGAEWTLYVWEDNVGFSKQYIGTATGVEGQTNKFHFSSGNPTWCPYSFCVAQESDVEYVLNEGTRSCDLTMTNLSGVSTDSAYSDYTIEYHSLQPILFKRAQIISGKMDILYKDLVRKSERATIVEVKNQIATYAENK